MTARFAPELTVLVIGLILTPYLRWGFTTLVGERWQFFATIPTHKDEEGRWHGINLTFYGLLSANAYVIALAIFVLMLGLAASGALMARAEVFEELHEALAWTLMGVVAIHVAGIVWHTIRHRENIALSMVDGHKRIAKGAAIESSHALAAVAFLGLTGLWAGALYDGYDAAGRQVTLPLLGVSVQLGEAEGAHAERGEHEEHEEHDDDDD